MPRRWWRPPAAGAVALCIVLLAAALLAGCTPKPPAPPAVSAQAPTQETSTFGCVTPSHFCPNAFDIDLRQKPCTCQGEPGRFHYRPKAP